MNHQTVRQSIVGICRDLSCLGFMPGTGGNVAVRVSPEFMAVTPSGTDYMAMEAEDICILRISDLQQVHGRLAPSVETDLHRRVLLQRPDCHCSLHTHQPAASAVGLLGTSLPVASGSRRILIGENAILVGYAPSGTRWLAAKLSAAVKPDIQAYLMRNHGVLCCGPDMPTTVATLMALEAEAESYLRQLITLSIQPESNTRFEKVLTTLDRDSAAKTKVSWYREV